LNRGPPPVWPGATVAFVAEALPGTAVDPRTFVPRTVPVSAGPDVAVRPPASSSPACSPWCRRSKRSKDRMDQAGLRLQPSSSSASGLGAVCATCTASTPTPRAGPARCGSRGRFAVHAPGLGHAARRPAHARLAPANGDASLVESQCPQFSATSRGAVPRIAGATCSRGIMPTTRASARERWRWRDRSRAAGSRPRRPRLLADQPAPRGWTDPRGKTAPTHGLPRARTSSTSDAPRAVAQTTRRVSVPSTPDIFLNEDHHPRAPGVKHPRRGASSPACTPSGAGEPGRTNSRSASPEAVAQEDRQHRLWRSLDAVCRGPCRPPRPRPRPRARAARRARAGLGPASRSSPEVRGKHPLGHDAPARRTTPRERGAIPPGAVAGLLAEPRGRPFSSGRLTLVDRARGHLGAGSCRRRSGSSGTRQGHGPGRPSAASATAPAVAPTTFALGRTTRRPGRTGWKRQVDPCGPPIRSPCARCPCGVSGFSSRSRIVRTGAGGPSPHDPASATEPRQHVAQAPVRPVESRSRPGRAFALAHYADDLLDRGRPQRTARATEGGPSPTRGSRVRPSVSSACSRLSE